MRPCLFALLLFALGCGPTTSSHARGTASGSTSASGTSAGLGQISGSTGAATGQAICADCTDDAQCQSGFCDVFDPQGDGFCDASNPCQADTDCLGAASCNAASGTCECPQLGGVGMSSSSGTGGGTGPGSSSGTGTGSGTGSGSSSSSGSTTSSSSSTGGTCTPCTSTSQCGTGHCLKESGGTNYYCGADCTADPTICPAGWTCSSGLSGGKSGCRAVAPTCP